MEDELLNVDEVAEHLGVGPVTVYRWCRDGSLPCLKVGRAWRIRRSALEEFLMRNERSATLVGRLRSFLEVPDNVLGIAQSRELMLWLDAAFFQVGEVRGGTLIKYHASEPEACVDELRSDLERKGLEVERLEEEGRLRLFAESGPPGRRADELRRLITEGIDEGRTVWIDFNWEERIDLDAALKQQEEITGLIGDSRLVIKTSVLEPMLDNWPGTAQRQVQVLHSGTIWLSEYGLVLSRVTPPPAL